MKISLHIGLNSVDPKAYFGWSGKLYACEQDAKDMFDLAIRRGFTATQLLTKQGTGKAFFEFLDYCAANCKKGDTVFITYSGHGGQLFDQSNDEKDKADETICLYDGQVPDDEINAAFARLRKGVKIIFITDSCHSGTVNRLIASDNVRPKAMPTYIASHFKRTAPRQVVTTFAPLLVHLAACRDNQTALDGSLNGVFTAGILTTVRAGSSKTWAQFTAGIKKESPASQVPQLTIRGGGSTAERKVKPDLVLPA